MRTKSLLQGLKNVVGVGMYLLLVGGLLEALTILLWQRVSFPVSLPFGVRVALTLPCLLGCISGMIWFNQTLNLVKIHLAGGENVLVTSGPFNYVRHPLYATLLLTLPPLFIIWYADLLFIVPWALMLLIAHIVVQVEERGLVRVFGEDYVRYKGYVPALLPYKGAGGARYREEPERDREGNGTMHHAITLRILTGITGLAVFSAVWFWIAGGVAWWQGWAFLLTFIIYVSILGWRLSKLNPDLIRERNQPADKAEAWDRVVMGIYSMMLVVLLIISALDGGRYSWSVVPLGVQLIGWGLLVVAGMLVWHVMMTNAYLSSWARIQEDRGQVVVQEGMYRRIRHPMYLGIIVGFLGIPLVLGSWWAMIPGAVIAGIFVYRTYLEDQMLIDGLDGYAEYTEVVKYRLLPGIW